MAIISSHRERALHFYVNLLGFRIIAETIRDDHSHKIDLVKTGVCTIELFIFAHAPHRTSYPEARGLRHLALDVSDIEVAVRQCKKAGIITEAIRTDAIDKKRFTFIFDPDNLPIELCERSSSP